MLIWRQYRYYPNFEEEETYAKHGSVIYPKSHNYSDEECEFKVKLI